MNFFQLIKSLSVLILFFIIKISVAQKVEVITKVDRGKLKAGNDFAFIESALDTSGIVYIATIKATGKENASGIQALYISIQGEALGLGANAFRLNSFVKNENDDESILILDTYFINDSILDLNWNFHEKNVIYIFGGERKRDSTDFSFKVNNKKKNIKSGEFYRRMVKKNEKVKINKGGFAGMTMWVDWKEWKPPTFLSLSGFGLSGPSPIGTVGASFHTGRLTRVEPNLGHLLVKLLKPVED
jgi:hypothetical protein